MLIVKIKFSLDPLNDCIPTYESRIGKRVSIKPEFSASGPGSKIGQGKG